MSPLHTFLNFAEELKKKPVYFWSKDNKIKLLKNANTAISSLKKTLESKKLEDTIAYRTLVTLQNSIAENTVDEVSFTEALKKLADIYHQAQKKEGIKKIVSDLDRMITVARQQTLEYHLALEALRINEKKMTDEQKAAADKETIQKIGIFYVFEYTSQVLYEFSRISDAEKKRLMNDGLKTDAGNLPGYLPLEDTFRKELCLKIYNEKLRNTLLEAFYNFEEICGSEDMNKVGKALKKFNLALLSAFRYTGLTFLKAIIYAPFGKNISLDELTTRVESLKMS